MKKFNKIFASLLAMPLVFSMLAAPLKAWHFPSVSYSYIETENNLVLIQGQLIALRRAVINARRLPNELVAYIDELIKKTQNLLDLSQVGTAAQFLDKVADIYHGIQILNEYLKTPFKEKPELLSRKKIGDDKFNAKRYTYELQLPSFSFLEIRNLNNALQSYVPAKDEEIKIKNATDVFIFTALTDIQLLLNKVRNLNPSASLQYQSPNIQDWDLHLNTLKAALKSLPPMAGAMELLIGDAIDKLNSHGNDWRPSSILNTVVLSYFHVLKVFEQLSSKIDFTNLPDLQHLPAVNDLEPEASYPKLFALLQDVLHAIKRLREEILSQKTLFTNRVTHRARAQQKKRIKTFGFFCKGPFRQMPPTTRAGLEVHPRQAFCSYTERLKTDDYKVVEAEDYEWNILE